MRRFLTKERKELQAGEKLFDIQLKTAIKITNCLAESEFVLHSLAQPKEGSMESKYDSIQHKICIWYSL
jgi:hypothetical protein